MGPTPNTGAPLCNRQPDDPWEHEPPPVYGGVPWPTPMAPCSDCGERFVAITLSPENKFGDRYCIHCRKDRIA